MKELTSIQQIDAVLKTFSNFKNNDYKTSIFGFVDLEANTNLSFDDIRMILAKLKKDGYVERVVPEKPELVSDIEYYLTFEGKLFIEQGCYGQEIKDRIAKRNRDTAFALSVGIGTALAGTYALWQIVMYLLQQLSHCK